MNYRDALQAAGDAEVFRLMWARPAAQAVPDPVAEDTTEPTVILINPNYPRTKEVQ